MDSANLENKMEEVCEMKTTEEALAALNEIVSDLEEIKKVSPENVQFFIANNAVLVAAACNLGCILQNIETGITALRRLSK